jgi:hypothetical protein
MEKTPLFSISGISLVLGFVLCKAGVPNLGDASPWGDLGGLKLVIFWVLLYQWGDAVGLRGDAET